MRRAVVNVSTGELVYEELTAEEQAAHAEATADLAEVARVRSIKSEAARRILEHHSLTDQINMIADWINLLPMQGLPSGDAARVNSIRASISWIRSVRTESNAAETERRPPSWPPRTV